MLVDFYCPYCGGTRKTTPHRNRVTCGDKECMYARQRERIESKKGKRKRRKAKVTRPPKKRGESSTEPIPKNAIIIEPIGTSCNYGIFKYLHNYNILNIKIGDVIHIFGQNYFVHGTNPIIATTKVNYPRNGGVKHKVTIDNFSFTREEA